METEKIFVPGSFNVKDKIIVSDPCYLIDKPAAKSFAAVSGGWFSYVVKRNGRVNELHAFSGNLLDLNENWEEAEGVGVDSGLMGIYCETELTQTQTLEGENWYDILCTKMHEKSQIISLACIGLRYQLIKKYSQATTGASDKKIQKMVDKEISSIFPKPLGAELVSGGVVSFSGYGDGHYPVFLKRDSNNRIYHVKIVFVETE